MIAKDVRGLKDGDRAIVVRFPSSMLYEVTVVEVSPSGDRIKFKDHGWQDVREWQLVERLP